MTNVRRRKAKSRRPAASVVVPGARARLIVDQYEYGWDPRTDPPTGNRELLDPLESGEGVTVDAWELGDDLWRQFGGMYARVRVDDDDVVTLIEPVDGPLALPDDHESTTNE